MLDKILAPKPKPMQFSVTKTILRNFALENRRLLCRLETARNREMNKCRLPCRKWATENLTLVKEHLLSQKVTPRIRATKKCRLLCRRTTLKNLPLLQPRHMRLWKWESREDDDAILSDDLSSPSSPVHEVSNASDDQTEEPSEVGQETIQENIRFDVWNDGRVRRRPHRKRQSNSSVIAYTTEPIAGYRRSNFQLGTLTPLFPFSASSSSQWPYPYPHPNTKTLQIHTIHESHVSNFMGPPPSQLGACTLQCTVILPVWVNNCHQTRV